MQCSHIPYGLSLAAAGNSHTGRQQSQLREEIVGEQVGLHPVATLMAMFLGTKLLGIVGLFGFPIGLVILKKLNDSGKIKLFK